MVDLTQSVCVTLYHPLNCLWGDRLSCANGIQFSATAFAMAAATAAAKFAMAAAAAASAMTEL